MIFRDLFQSGVRMANTNAPAILTAFGAVGVVTTAVLAVKAGYDSHDRLLQVRLEKTGAPEPGAAEIELVALTKLETGQAVWPLYIGAVTSGVLSCGAIVMAHRVSSRRAMALAAAYAMSEGRLEEYQDKVKEKFGIKKEKEAREELVQERINRTYDEGSIVFSPTDGKVLIKEEYTGRIFWSSIDEINKAVNEVNHEINMSGSVRLSDFYDLLKLEHVSTSDYFGFTHEERLELEWNTATTPDGKTPIHTFEYVNHPVINPERGHTPFR